MTDTKLTAAHLYGTDPTFRCLVDEWVRDRRCPLPLVDRCLDFDLTGAAECARWAATEPRREKSVGSPVFEYPYPSTPEENTTGRYSWFRESYPLAAHRDVPFGRVPCHLMKSDSVTQAILWLLDHWRAG